MTISVRAYREGTPVEGTTEPEAISDRLEEGCLVWVDVAEPTEEDIEICRVEFGLHPESMQDLRERNQRTKVDQYGDYFQVVAYGLSGGVAGIVSHEVHIYAGRRYLLTFRFEPAFDVRRAVHRWELTPTLDDFGGAALLHVLLDEIVDTYFPVVEDFDDAAEALEERVFADDVETGLQEDLFRLKKKLVEFRRHVVPLRDVLDFLEEDLTIIPNEAKPYFRDVYDNVYRAMEFVDNQRETLSAALSAYQASVANQMNVVMKKLTAWAGILLVPTLIAGIYGMNFEHMPELSWWFGYPAALGLMLVVCSLMYRGFKKRGWF